MQTSGVGVKFWVNEGEGDGVFLGVWVVLVTEGEISRIIGVMVNEGEGGGNGSEIPLQEEISNSHKMQ